jgi:glyoxalase superfamily protein
VPSATSDIHTVIPILRMYDVAATQRFNVDYLGCSLRSQTVQGDGPPGSVVLIVTHALDALHAELDAKDYPFMNPGIDEAPGGGRQLVLIDPASNSLRFYEP